MLAGTIEDRGDGVAAEGVKPRGDRVGAVHPVAQRVLVAWLRAEHAARVARLHRAVDVVAVHGVEQLFDRVLVVARVGDP